MGYATSVHALDWLNAISITAHKGHQRMNPNAQKKLAIVEISLG